MFLCKGARGTRVVVLVLGQGIVKGCPRGNCGESEVVRFELEGISY
jgi:hypothetical protein